jgi:hypothetical protein
MSDMGRTSSRCSAAHRLRGPARRGCNHSMRDSAQVTAPGAIISMITAVSSRPNKQNRSTCSRISLSIALAA